MHNEIRTVFNFSFTLFTLSPSNAGVELDAMNDLCRRLNPLIFPFSFPFTSFRTLLCPTLMIAFWQIKYYFFPSCPFFASVNGRA